MEASEHNSRIEKIAEMILSDNISLNTQEQNILKKYHDFAKENYNLDQDSASELVNEAFFVSTIETSTRYRSIDQG